MKRKYIDAYMQIAEVFAGTSEANRLKVGALIVKDGGIISEGCNGTPRGWIDNVCEGSDGLTLGVVRHAETNALNKLRRSTMTSVGASMFCNYSCCVNCAIDIVDAGIKQFFYKEAYRDLAGLDYLSEHGVEVVQL